MSKLINISLSYATGFVLLGVRLVLIRFKIETFGKPIIQPVIVEMFFLRNYILLRDHKDCVHKHIIIIQD